MTLYLGAVGATVDCEALRQGILRQPVNALTSLALVVAGLWLLRRGGARWVGLALIATGIGSFLFHGPLAPEGEWIHDVTLAWLLSVVLVEQLRLPAFIHLSGLGAFAAGFALLPATADWIMAGLAVAIVIALVARSPTRGTWLQLLLLATVAALGRLGATGGPWCSETSLLQLHGVWHIGAAAAVTWWAIEKDRTTHPVTTSRR